MLSCVPQSFLNWNFEITGSRADPSFITMDFLSEQGTITHVGATYRIQKQGWLSGTWLLISGAEALVTAVKPSAWLRAFEITTREGSLLLKAQSPLTRCYDIFSEGRNIGTIFPAHPFTRRSTIECDTAVPELTQLFCFWLVALTWRRSRQNNSGE